VRDYLIDRFTRGTTPVGLRGNVEAAATSVLALVIVTAAIALLKSIGPVISLGVLYVFAVLPVALAYGLAYAIAVSIGGMLLFNFFFLSPVHAFTLEDSRNWFALAVYVVTAVVVSELAARARRRATEAEQREAETALLAEIATSLLQGGDVAGRLGWMGDRVAAVLHAPSAAIVLGSGDGGQTPNASPIELRAGGRRVGTLELVEGGEPNLAARRRLLPALASLLAVAIDRERLARSAVEAEALRQSDTIKTAVLRAVSHDLRSPLTAIRAAADGLGNPQLQLSDHDRRELLDTITVEVRRLEHVIDNLLALSRLQAGAAAAQLEVWQVEDIVYRALAEVTGADRVKVSIPEDMPPVTVDAVQVQRILVNLLENALKFSPEQAQVTVRGTKTRKEAILRVIDQGRGVPEEELEHVFEPFYRGAPAQDQTGTGLGLAIARGFAEANGGRLWAESRPGQGAVFALALPTAEEPPA
jgi:two-component system sensor histidine kinase KdpD